MLAQGLLYAALGKYDFPMYRDPVAGHSYWNNLLRDWQRDAALPCPGMVRETWTSRPYVQHARISEEFMHPGRYAVWESGFRVRHTDNIYIYIYRERVVADGEWGFVLRVCIGRVRFLIGKHTFPIGKHRLSKNRWMETVASPSHS